MKRAAVFTLGCKVNQYESESISTQLQEAGYEVVDWREIADLYVVHTCAVTSQAAAKSRQQIHQAHRKNPEAQIVVMGCYAQLDAEVISEMPGVRFVIGTTERQRFLGNLAQRILDKRDDRVENLVREFQTDETFEEMKGINQADYSRPMIKIQEGCNNFCSYCIIPYLRGPERSREAEHILEEVRGLVAQGYQEIVLTGIHLTSYGVDNQKGSLLEVISRIHEIEGYATTVLHCIGDGRCNRSHRERQRTILLRSMMGRRTLSTMSITTKPMPTINRGSRMLARLIAFRVTSVES